MSSTPFGYGAAIEAFTIGVEEEYQVVDADTLALRPRADRILPLGKAVLGKQLQGELNLSQLEIGTPISHSLDEVHRHLARLRAAVTQAAREHDSLIAAVATHPFTEWLGQTVAPEGRYGALERQYRQLAWEQLLCGCHVHIGVPDRELAVRVIDRARPWLSVLLALSANSPFWQGIDTGYASYRTELYGRWPTAGTPPFLGSTAEYDAVVRELVETKTIEDASFLYWDARPSTKFETVEFRVMDVALSVDNAVMLAGLVRSLVRTCAAAASAGDAPPEPRAPLLTAARWRAARDGVDGELVHVPERRAAPAPEVVDSLLECLRPDLEDHGEWDTLSELVTRTLVDGNGARRQRRAYEQTGELGDVMAYVVRETLGEGFPTS